MNTPPTDKEIMEYVYSNTFQETSDCIESFIKGMIEMRNIWIKTLEEDE